MPGITDSSDPQPPLTTAAEAAAVYLGLPGPAYLCAGCDRRPRFDGRCDCS